MVNARHEQARPVQLDPKTGKPLPASSTPGRSTSPQLNQDMMNEPNGGFFGSFFASKANNNKKKMAAMEAPPPMLKASGTLSEREGTEVEIISMSSYPAFTYFTNTVRTSHQLVLQYRKEDNDRHGAQSHHVEPCAIHKG